jgi:hypothetical protein
MKRRAFSTACWVTIQFEDACMDKPPDSESNLQTAAESEWIALVREKVASLRYGVVQIVIHDGRVTQIERNEKTRLRTGREGNTEE